MYTNTQEYENTCFRQNVFIRAFVEHYDVIKFILDVNLQ